MIFCIENKLSTGKKILVDNIKFLLQTKINQIILSKMVISLNQLTLKNYLGKLNKAYKLI